MDIITSFSIEKRNICLSDKSLRSQTFIPDRYAREHQNSSSTIYYQVFLKMDKSSKILLLINQISNFPASIIEELVSHVKASLLNNLSIDKVGTEDYASLFVVAQVVSLIKHLHVLLFVSCLTF